MATERKKRTVLTLEQRIKALEQLDRGKPAYKIAEEFGVGKTQIQNLRKRKSDLLSDFESNVPGETKRRRYLTGNEDINNLTYEWFKDAVNRRIVITGPLIQEQALHFASNLGKTDFKASKGWLESFIKRHSIKFGCMTGERGDVNQTTVKDWTDKLPVLCAGYDSKDIFNMDESGLFFRDTTRKTYHFKGDDCAGGKRSKERITVAFCASMNGEKLKPIVIGKSRAPRCFGRLDISRLPVDYYYNTKAWMNSYIYEDFLKSFNKKMKAQKRNVLLFVDNAPSHPKVSNLSHVKVQFLPPNTTSHTQPMDQGIIQAVKLKFRKRQLQHVIRGMEKHSTLRGSELLKQITVLDAIYWIYNSWMELDTDTITKCFSKAGFKFCEKSSDNTAECEDILDVNAAATSSKDDDDDFGEGVVGAGDDDDDDDDDVPLGVMQMSQALFGCSFKDLVELDKELFTCDTQDRNWNAPVETLLSELRPTTCVQNDDSDVSDEEVTESVISSSEACTLVDKLKCFAKQNGNTELMECLTKAEDELCKIVLESYKLKQSSITDFFQKRTV